jgi:hypothetical protein
MRRGMSCSECGLTDDGMQADSANDDASDQAELGRSPDAWSARGLLGDRLWALYCERWQPMRYAPRDLARWVLQCLRRRSA